MDYYMVVRVKIFLKLLYFCKQQVSISKFHSAEDRELQHLMVVQAAPYKKTVLLKKEGFKSLV